MQTEKVFYGVILEFRPSDPIGVSNTVIELLPRRRREAFAAALQEVPPPVERASNRLLYERHEDAVSAARRLRAVADRVSLQQLQRRNDMETESVYGLGGWLMPSGHQYVPISGREEV